MYSEEEKWIMMREMVREKYYELKQALRTVGDPFTRKHLTEKYKPGVKYSIFTGENMMTEYDHVKELIRSRFLPSNKIDKSDESRTNWLNSISAVDLLHVYSFINNILSCFYYYVNDLKIPNENIIPYEYEFRRTSYDKAPNDAIYKAFYGKIKNDNQFKNFNKFYIKSGKNKTLKFVEPKEEYIVTEEMADENYRKKIVSLLIDEAYNRFYNALNRDEKTDIQLEFRDILKHFYLTSFKEDNYLFRLKNIPEPNPIKPYQFEFDQLSFF